MKYKYIECQCGTIEHLVRFAHSGHNDWDEIYIDVYLNSYYGFFKRLWYGVKYIFGYKSQYGAFDETWLTKETAKELKDFIEEWLNAHKESK